MHGGELGGTNNRQMPGWNTMWQVESPGKFLKNRMIGGALGCTNNHQVAWWNTRWQVKAPGEFLKNRWFGGPPGGTVEQWCNGCAISCTMDKLCYCSAQRETTKRSQNDLMARMHGNKVIWTLRGARSL